MLIALADYGENNLWTPRGRLVLRNKWGVSTAVNEILTNTFCFQGRWCLLICRLCLLCQLPSNKTAFSLWQYFYENSDDANQNQPPETSFFIRILGLSLQKDHFWAFVSVISMMKSKSVFVFLLVPTLTLVFYWSSVTIFDQRGGQFGKKYLC